MSDRDNNRLSLLLPNGYATRIKKAGFMGRTIFLSIHVDGCNLSRSICPNKFPSNRTAKPRGT